MPRGEKHDMLRVFVHLYFFRQDRCKRVDAETGADEPHAVSCPLPHPQRRVGVLIHGGAQPWHSRCSGQYKMTRYYTLKARGYLR